MKQLTICTLLLLLSGIVSAQATYTDLDLPSRLVVELDDNTSRLIRDEGFTPVFLEHLKSETSFLSPVFRLPDNVKHQKVWYKHGLNRWFILHWEGHQKAEEIAAELQAGNGLIKYEIVRPYKALRLPDDYEIHDKWDLDAMHLPEAWDLQTGSREVIICTIDTGCEIAHPDLMENVWINPGEDINGNGIWDDEDNNGEDDDDNGFVDDIAGWDFVNINVQEIPPPFLLQNEDYSNPDNEVFPDIFGHGSHTAGIAAGVTDNGEGIAAASWNVRSMSLRTGFGISLMGELMGGADPTAFGPAIQYAVENGARVISMSFGGEELEAVEDAVNFAHDLNVILFAAAGNNDDQAIGYPAGYDNVIAVAATGREDIKAAFSTYGDWIDICAPGVAISSLSNENDSYIAHDGTSMACPNAASVAGLVLSVFPEMEVAMLEDILISTCDNIDEANPNYRGLLGAGRLNAFAAVQAAGFPVMQVHQWTLNEPNGNYHPDPGETSELALTIVNRSGWNDAEEVSIEFNIEHNLIQYEQNVFELGAIEPDAEISTENDPFVFEVSENFNNTETITVAITITAQPGDIRTEYDIELLVGTPDIVLVDDDGGADLDQYILSDLNELGITCFHHDLSAILAYPQPGHLAESGTLIWMAGDNEDLWLEDGVEILEDAIDSGTNVFIFGQTLDEELQFQDFYGTYLHAESDEGETDEELSPVYDDGGPERTDYNMLLNGRNGARNSTDPDVVTPIDGAMSAFRYYQTESVAGIYYEEEIYKLVYFPFAFEAVSGERRWISRQAVISSILDWFNEVNSVPDFIGKGKPAAFQLLAAYPNPFNPALSIDLAMPAAGLVQAQVFDLNGRLVSEIYNNNLTAGTHSLTWDAGSFNAGAYFLKVADGKGQSVVSKVLLVK